MGQGTATLDDVPCTNICPGSASYADRDAQYFADYARGALGVPAGNIKLLVNDDARMLSIKSALKRWLPAVASRGQSNVYLFFAGHGLATPNGDQVYLLEDSALRREEGCPATYRRHPPSRRNIYETTSNEPSRSP